MSNPAIILYPYQQDWLTDSSRFKIGMFARQTGKTFTSTLEIADHCLDAESQGRKERWVILSRGERQAREAMEEGIKRHLNAYQMTFEALDYDWEGSYKALEVTLPNGSRITALPANPDTARGFSANVFLDEFAFHQDSRKIWQALFPVISRPGLLLRITSTPNGKGNKFYELMTGDDPQWSRHTVDIYQAVEDGLPRDVEQLRQAISDDDAWATEFELQWLDTASAWLDYDLISSVEHDQAGDPDGYTGGPVYIGVDIARYRDLWVAWALEEVGDVLWTREIRARRRITFAQQEAELHEMMSRYRVARLCLDRTGLGEKPTEDAQRRYGTGLVEGVAFTASNKLTLATVGKQKFEDRKIRIPLGDADLRTDLHKLRKSVSPTGTVRFDADADASGHADRTWACFLACYAATHSFGPIAYQVASRPASTTAYTAANFAQTKNSYALRRRR